MRNIIDAICEVVNNPQYKLKEYIEMNNRANSMGAALEDYVLDIFAGTVGIDNPQIRNKLISENFSYLGNMNNPPDSILLNGDAIEVKKIESKDSSLALNSSYPKSKLFSNSSMISRACRECEEWSEKDIIYAVGVAKGGLLTSLALVYGSEYCAEQETYKRIKDTIKSGIETIPCVEFAETKELGRVNRVDPLGVTYLRVRGMWGIENPFKVFDYVYTRDNSKCFNFMSIISLDKFNTFTNKEKLFELSKQKDSLIIREVDVKNPNNPAKSIRAILINYSV